MVLTIRVNLDVLTSYHIFAFDVNFLLPQKGMSTGMIDRSVRSCHKTFVDKRLNFENSKTFMHSIFFGSPSFNLVLPIHTTEI